MLDRTVPPTAHRIEGIHIKQPDRYQTKNGLPFYVINSGSQPVIKLEWIVDAGKWFEVKNGVSILTAKTIKEGTSSFSSKQISEAFDSVGAHLEITPTLDKLSISMYVMTKHLSSVLPFYKELLLSPTFPEQEFETQRDIQIQTLKVNLEKTSFVASLEFRKQVFGSEHPYGRVAELDDLRKVQKDDLIDHFKSRVQGKPATVIASGQLDQELVGELAESFDFDINHSVTPIAESTSHRSGTKKIDISKEGSTQKSLRLGCETINLNHPDFPALCVANEIFGGYFGSRLMRNIREDKGLTYGIYSSISTLQYGSFFTIAADVKKELSEQAISEIRKEAETICADLVPENELDLVRNYMLGQLQSSINTPFALSSKFKGVHFHGLDYSYYDRLVNTIQNISSEQVRDMAAKYLDHSKFIEVQVG